MGPALRTNLACTVNVECAHRSAEGGLHGHSYLVEIWSTAGGDLLQYEAAMKRIAARVDHTLAETVIGDPSMEALGRWFAEQGTSAGWMVVRVVVRRPTLGYAVEVLVAA
jgi:6-pyruvoyl-tetrahydropterin synthase